MYECEVVHMNRSLREPENICIRSAETKGQHSDASVLHDWVRGNGSVLCFTGNYYQVPTDVFKIILNVILMYRI